MVIGPAAWDGEAAAPAIIAFTGTWDVPAKAHA